MVVATRSLRLIRKEKVGDEEERHHALTLLFISSPDAQSPCIFDSVTASENAASEGLTAFLRLAW